MGDAVIGALRVTLAMDAGEFSKGSDRAYARATQLEKQLADVAKRIGVAFGALQLGEAITKSFEGLNQLNKLSEQTGIGVESLSKLKFAANEVGVGFDAFSSIVEHFNVELNKMAQNEVTPAGQALALLGVNARDASGQFKNFDLLLPQLADKFAGYANGASKSALATALFGKAGAELIPMLNQGAAGLEHLGDEARKTGNVFDAGVAQQIKEAEKAANLLKASFDGLVQQLTISMAPALKVVASVVSVITEGFGALNKMSTAELNKEIDSTNDRLRGLYDERQRYNNSTTGIGWVDAAQLRVLETDIARTEEKLKDLRTTLSDRTALQVDIKAPAPDLSAVRKAKEDLDALLDDLHGLPVLMGKSFAFDTKPFEDAMAKIDRVRALDGLTAAQVNKMKLGLLRTEQQEILNTATLAADALTKVFNGNKLAAIASGIINTAVGVTKALSASPPPFNFINAALVAAAGAAQIASIKSTSQSGGGSVTPVGSGGAAASTAAAQTVAAPSDSVLRVEGISSDALFSGDAVRGLARKLLEFQADGGKIVLK